MILYHITPRKNLESIKELGIIPAYAKGITCYTYTYKKPVVWLTDNPEYILTSQAGEDWIKENDPIVIKVNCDGLNIKPYTSYNTNEIVNHEFYFEGTIKQHFGVEQ